MKRNIISFLIATSLLAACSEMPAGIAPSRPANTTVMFDFFHKPLPEIPLPNDIATRFDATSATGLRINASHIAPTGFEGRIRELLDTVDGWGTLQPIVIPFTGPLSVDSIVAGHRDPNYGLADDVLLVINLDPDSPQFGEASRIDLGEGNYPVVLEDRNKYWKNDPRGDSWNLVFEETDEDLNNNGELDASEDLNNNRVLDPGEDVNSNGVLDPSEDTDADGVLDKPNYYPGMSPAADDLAGRADALMTFYEKETHTLIAKPLVPLLERTTYAVVVTRRLLDEAGQPVGSPFDFVNHTSQTEALKPLADHLPAGTTLDDVAFAFTFTTQSVKSEWKAVRDGMYGLGVQKHIAENVPAKIDMLFRLRDADRFTTTKPHLLWGEVWQTVVPTLATELLNMNPDGQGTLTWLAGAQYIDYFVMGQFKSPQLYSRCGFNVPNETCQVSDWQGLNEQSWPPDLDRVPAQVEAETITFTLAVPRKEVSVRGQGKPAPIIIMGHGYGSQRFEGMQFAHYLTKSGFAVLAIDGPSHGIGLSAQEGTTARELFGALGLASTVVAVLTDRAKDQNNDGVKDSAADFWSAYFFHTRDIVRQFGVDYMQLIKIFRSFDGQRQWVDGDVDVDGSWLNGIAGDFDGDGVVDAGGPDVTFAMSGGSLGGIMSMMVGSIEPGMDLIAPISGGGGYSDIGIRSKQGGVPEAFILRGMGPLYVATIEGSGETLIETIIPNLNSTGQFAIARVPAGDILPGDTMIVENLASGEFGCGYVSAVGTARTSVESDLGDATVIRFYRGDVLDKDGHKDCEHDPSATASVTINTFEMDVTFNGDTIPADTELAAMAEGLGLRRTNPDLRRVQGIAQLVLGPGDPAVMAPHMMLDPIEYATGETSGSHALIISTMGDMNVPVSSGILVARAAGLINYLDDDPRYGKPVNQELIDNYTGEAVHLLKRYTDPNGNGVHLDVENFSQGTDYYGTDVPRITDPIHLGWNEPDALGGTSAAIFPYTLPGGQHGFQLPGEMVDTCEAVCGAPCSCADTFDVGEFMFNMIMRWAMSGGQALTDDLDWPDMPAPPPVRLIGDLD